MSPPSPSPPLSPFLSSVNISLTLQGDSGPVRSARCADLLAVAPLLPLHTHHTKRSSCQKGFIASVNERMETRQVNDRLQTTNSVRISVISIEQALYSSMLKFSLSFHGNHHGCSEFSSSAQRLLCPPKH